MKSSKNEGNGICPICGHKCSTIELFHKHMDRHFKQMRSESLSQQILILLKVR
jgi:uncharacterized Zn finger protein (UPF0148 family)